MSRRLWILLGVAAAAVVLVAVGRAERSHDLGRRNAEIRRIRALVDTNLGAHLNAYRTTPAFGCFLYGSKAEPFGIELCFDDSGRIVEAIDRRDPEHVHIATLRFDTGAATSKVDTTRLLALLKQRDPKRYGSVQSLPFGPDRGPIPFPQRTK